MSIIYERPTIYFGVLQENHGLTHPSGKPTLEFAAIGSKRVHKKNINKKKTNENSRFPHV